MSLKKWLLVRNAKARMMKLFMYHVQKVRRVKRILTYSPNCLTACMRTQTVSFNLVVDILAFIVSILFFES